VKPPETSDFKKPLIVVRALETKAAYALRTADHTLEIARKLKVLGNVLLLERYDALGNDAFASKEEIVDSAKVVANADLVVSAGGTIAREAALQGIPSIVISELGRTYVNTYLARKGFPIFMSDARKVLSLAKRHLGKKVDVAAKLAQFDNPVDIIEKTVMKMQLTAKT
jgi:predicted glycosyltransferase